MTGGAAGGGVRGGGRLALVTGGSSFVGSHLVPALLGAGYRVRTTSRGARPAGLAAEVEHVPADLTAGAPLDGVVEGVDVVFHVAGASSSFSSEAEMELANGGATERLLDAVRRAGITRLLYVSTSAVYGEEEPLPQPILETVTPHPSRGYGRTKWLAEEAVARWSASGGEAIVVRPVTMYGPR
ncbi:MAG TPA: NAD(P)-dependent oxidoreductase, partial [Candidatus Dormibacteraeota bacterium]|nr:NAD(P)-dependent oxidoreductase [Candidatus Dormibacteraeota bacterium]